MKYQAALPAVLILLSAVLLFSAENASSFVAHPRVLARPSFAVDSLQRRTAGVRTAAIPGMRRIRRFFNRSSDQTTVPGEEQETATVEEQKYDVGSSSSAISSEGGVLDNQPVTVGQAELSLPEEVQSESQKLMQKVKDAGTAGIISYALWELGFWAVSIPVVIFGYLEVAGHWPDLSNKEDMAKLGAEAFAFVNFARFAVPLRIGLALSTTPWIQENIVDRFFEQEKDDGDSRISEKA